MTMACDGLYDMEGDRRCWNNEHINTYCSYGRHMNFRVGCVHIYNIRLLLKF